MISDLQRWLDIVTGVFPHETATRLRRELEAHARETAQMLQAEGHPNPEAAALHALGNAREVRRRLEETHFTRAEVEWLRQDSATRRVLERGFYPGGWWRLFNFVAAVLVLSLPLINLQLNGTFSWTNTLIYWGFAVMAVLMERFVIIRFSSVAAAILWRVLSVVAVPIWTMLFLFLFKPHNMGWGELLVTALAQCGVLYFLRPRAALSLLPKALRNAA